MEQLNQDIAETTKECQSETMDSKEDIKNSFLDTEVRQKFSIFGVISLSFGGAFTFCFYKANIGLNAFLFALVMVFLLNIVMKKLSFPIKKATIACYLGSLLLGLSSMLTSSGTLQFFNIVGIILLLDLSLLHQFNKDDQWDFLKYFGRMIGLVFHCIATIGMPFMDSAQFLTNTKLFKNEKVKNITLGIAIAIPLLWVIVALLSSADLLFGEMTKQTYQFLFSSNLFYVGIMILFGFLSCYCIICGSVIKIGVEDNNKQRKLADPSIAITAMTLLCLVYVVFCSIQVIYLFTNGLFILPAEFTFSEYARRGFFELLAVTVINIVLMLICSSFFRESKILRFILTIMTICTYIMIGSATYRMLLYIGAYNLTFMRLLVLLFLLIDALMLAGIIVSIYNKKIKLFGYCVGVVTVCYLLFSFARPDYYIASYHIQHKEELNMEDIFFLTKELSYDAAPIVVPLLSDPGRFDMTSSKNDQENSYQYDDRELEQSSIDDYSEQILLDEEERGIRDFNFSYYWAAKAIGK